MATTVLVCTDGSPLADEAIHAGLAIVAPAERLVIATVVEPVDPMLVTGGGMAGGVLTPAEAEEMQGDVEERGRAVVETLRTALGRADAEVVILSGSPGPALCDLAGDVGASVMVIGSRGRGGFRRAVLGSVSDHIVRNAPCPVLVTTAQVAGSPDTGEPDD